VGAADGYGGSGVGPSRGTQGERGDVTREEVGGPLAAAVPASSRGSPVTNASPADRAGGRDGGGSSAAGVRQRNEVSGEEDGASSVKRMRVHMSTVCAVPSGTIAVPPTARVWFECAHCRSLWGSSSAFERRAMVCAATTPAGDDEEGLRERGGGPGGREPAPDGNGEGWEGRCDEGQGKRPARSRQILAVAGGSVRCLYGAVEDGLCRYSWLFLTASFVLGVLSLVCASCCLPRLALPCSSTCICCFMRGCRRSC